MAISQNLRFTGDIPPDGEFDHRPGASLLQWLRRDLPDCGWQMGPIELWRDVGWSVTCSRGDSKLEVVVCAMAEGFGWYLQIAAYHRPGIIGRLLGKTATAGASEILSLANDVHATLAAQRGLGDFKWCWDEYPDDLHSTPEPAEEE